MEIYCGLCGKSGHQLFSHLREFHAMEPEMYSERCPGAPLISDEMADYLREERVKPAEGGLKKTVELFEVEFTVDILPSEHVAEVEDDYVFDPELSRRLLTCLRDGEKIMLVGPTGCGKSSLIEQLTARLNWPLVRVSASGGLTESDLLGEWTVREGETVFNHGFLPRAMRMGAVCLIDEIDGIEPSVAFSIHQLMEDRGQLVLLQNGGETITPHEDFRLVTTANTLGHGDEAGLYAGTRVLNEAFLDRFAAVFEMSYMPAAREAEIVHSRVERVPGSVVEKLVRVAGDVREAQQNEEVYCTFSTRRLIEVAWKLEQLGELGPALDLALLNRLAPADRRVVEEICQRHLGNMLEGGG
ncbi:MAG: AAA family ATPase [Planctomycetota bacterium]